MTRITIAALALVAGATAGCRDMGLDGNIPLEEARARETSELVAATMRPRAAPAQRLVVDGRLWVPFGLPLTLDASDLRAVGSADGQTVHARRWDQAPYDALFIPLPPAGGVAALGGAGPQEWQELRPVHGRSGPVPGDSGP
ncbi:MAG TPA: hypothetical protein VMM12_06955 [Longimicrobiales bacterium]|nr:hypothetical protein [Longimicrobiales bacterium]